MTQQLINSTSEADFTATVIELAQWSGWKVAHFRPARTKSNEWRTPMIGDPGFPDLVLAKDGSVIFAELKAEKGSTSPPQREWLGALSDTEPHVWRGTGVAAVAASEHFPQLYSVFLWRPSDMDEIRRVLGVDG